MSTDLEEVLTIEAVKKLQYHGLLNEAPDDLGCWTTPGIWFPTIFPSCQFYSGKIPSVYNRPLFFVYLGFQAQIAYDLFYGMINTADPTRTKMMAIVKKHVNSVCAANTNNWVPVDSLLAEGVMEAVGLVDSVKEEVKELYQAFERSPLIFQRYFDENHDKNFENLKLVDFIQELVYRRMQKLMALNEAALRYLP